MSRVWMVIELDDGSRQGFQIEDAHVDYQQMVDHLDAVWVTPPTYIRSSDFTARWTITTHRFYRHFTPTDRPPERRSDTPAIGPIRKAVEPPSPREINTDAGTPRSTD